MRYGGVDFENENKSNRWDCGAAFNTNIKTPE